MYSPYYYNSYTTNYSHGGAIVAMFAAGMLIFFLLFVTACYIYSGITFGRIFKKAGIPSWAAWVPFYNNWKIMEMGSFHGALSLLILIPGLGHLTYAVLFCIAAYRIGLKFGKSEEFVLLAIFLTPIWAGILAFGSAKWKGGTVGAPAAPVQS